METAEEREREVVKERNRDLGTERERERLGEKEREREKKRGWERERVRAKVTKRCTDLFVNSSDYQTITLTINVTDLMTLRPIGVMF